MSSKPEPAQEHRKAQPKTASGNPLCWPPISASFINPGWFIKYLARIDGVLLFADLRTIDLLSGNGNRCRAEVFNWVLDSEYRMTWIGTGESGPFPEAPEKPHTGEPLKYSLSTHGEISFYGRGQVGAAYDSGHADVHFAPYVLSDSFIVWKMDGRHQRMISDAAEAYSASK